MGRIATLGVVAAVALAGSLLGAGSSRGGDSELPVYVGAGVVPRQLPRRERAPVEFWISGEVRGPAGDRPTLKKMVLELDRNGSLEVAGLPTCGKHRLQAFDTTAVEGACGAAIVGKGTGVATLAYPENSPISVESELLAFNGGTRGRITTFFIRGAIGIVKREVVVSTVKIERIERGRYGLRATVKVPSISDGFGYLTGFSLRFQRRYGYESERRSVFSARCTDGKLVADGVMTFQDGPESSGPVPRTCGIRR